MLYAGSHKFQDFIFHIAVTEDGAAQSDRHVVRTDTMAGRPFQIYQNDLGRRDIIGVLQ